jgi:hypothetical protein
MNFFFLTQRFETCVYDIFSARRFLSQVFYSHFRPCEIFYVFSVRLLLLLKIEAFFLKRLVKMKNYIAAI